MSLNSLRYLSAFRPCRKREKKSGNGPSLERAKPSGTWICIDYHGARIFARQLRFWVPSSGYSKAILMARQTAVKRVNCSIDHHYKVLTTVCITAAHNPDLCVFCDAQTHKLVCLLLLGLLPGNYLSDWRRSNHSHQRAQWTGAMQKTCDQLNFFTIPLLYQHLLLRETAHQGLTDESTLRTVFASSAFSSKVSVCVVLCQVINTIATSHKYVLCSTTDGLTFCDS